MYIELYVSSMQMYFILNSITLNMCTVIYFTFFLFFRDRVISLFNMCTLSPTPIFGSLITEDLLSLVMALPLR